MRIKCRPIGLFLAFLFCLQLAFGCWQVFAQPASAASTPQPVELPGDGPVVVQASLSQRAAAPGKAPIQIDVALADGTAAGAQIDSVEIQLAAQGSSSGLQWMRPDLSDPQVYEQEVASNSHLPSAYTDEGMFIDGGGGVPDRTFAGYFSSPLPGGPVAICGFTLTAKLGTQDVQESYTLTVMLGDTSGDTYTYQTVFSLSALVKKPVIQLNKAAPTAEYTGSVTVTFDKGSGALKKDGGVQADIVSGTVLDQPGSYQLTVTDAAKNQAVAVFTIQQTVQLPREIAMQALPQKTVYAAGELLEVDGGSILCTYPDGDQQTVPLALDMCSPTGPFAANTTQQIAVYYQGQSTQFSVQVGERTLTGIEIAEEPKTSYIEGEIFTAVGGKLLCRYSDGSAQQLDIDPAWCSGYRADVIGPAAITVTYGGHTVSYDITVRQKQLQKLAFSALPSKLQYTQGQPLDLTGGELQLTYDNGETDRLPLLFSYCTGYDPQQLGQQQITVTYDDRQLSFSVLVLAPRPTGIELTAPYKSDYFPGQPLDVTGGKVTLLYPDGKRETVDLTAAMCTGFTSSHPGTCTVTVQWGGLQTSFTVRVKVAAVLAIAVHTPPQKQTYIQGQPLLLSGAQLTVYYEGGRSEQVPITSDMISGYRPQLLGSQKLTVCFGGNSASFWVQVRSRRPVSAHLVAGAPTVFLQGQAFTAPNARIQVQFDSGDTQVYPLTALAVAGYSSDLPGRQTITATYSEGGGSTSVSFLVEVLSRSRADELTGLLEALPLGRLTRRDTGRVEWLQYQYDALTALERTAVYNVGRLPLAQRELYLLDFPAVHRYCLQGEVILDLAAGEMSEGGDIQLQRMELEDVQLTPAVGYQQMMVLGYQLSYTGAVGQKDATLPQLQGRFWLYGLQDDGGQVQLWHRDTAENCWRQLPTAVDTEGYAVASLPGTGCYALQFTTQIPAQTLRSDQWRRTDISFAPKTLENDADLVLDGSMAPATGSDSLLLWWSVLCVGAGSAALLWAMRHP